MSDPFGGKSLSNAARKYRKLPGVIEAVRFNGRNYEEIFGFCGRPSGGKIHLHGDDHAANKILIHTLEGVMTADAGDWIIKGVKGEFYPCKPDIFAETYTEEQTQ